MKNITISMDDELARETGIEAARAGKSVSRFVAELLKERLEKSPRSAAGSLRPCNGS